MNANCSSHLPMLRPSIRVGILRGVDLRVWQKRNGGARLAKACWQGKLCTLSLISINARKQAFTPLPLSWQRGHLGRYFSGRDAHAPMALPLS